MREVGDHRAAVFEYLLSDEDGHVDYLEHPSLLIEKLGSRSTWLIESNSPQTGSTRISLAGHLPSRARCIPVVSIPK